MRKATARLVIELTGPVDEIELIVSAVQDTVQREAHVDVNYLEPIRIRELVRVRKPNKPKAAEPQLVLPNPIVRLDEYANINDATREGIF